MGGCWRVALGAYGLLDEAGAPPLGCPNPPTAGPPPPLGWPKLVGGAAFWNGFWAGGLPEGWPNVETAVPPESSMGWEAGWEPKPPGCGCEKAFAVSGRANGFNAVLAGAWPKGLPAVDGLPKVPPCAFAAPNVEGAPNAVVLAWDGWPKAPPPKGFAFWPRPDGWPKVKLFPGCDGGPKPGEELPEGCADWPKEGAPNGLRACPSVVGCPNVDPAPNWLGWPKALPPFPSCEGWPKALVV